MLRKKTPRAAAHSAYDPRRVDQLGSTIKAQSTFRTVSLQAAASSIPDPNTFGCARAIAHAKAMNGGAA